MGRASIFAAPLLIFVAGCPGPSEVPDGGADAGGIASPAAPTAPTPVTMACPDGWQTVDEPDGTRLCEPWPGGVRPTCADDELLVPGTGCEPIATCGDDELPELGPGVALVRADAATGGDGSLAAPYRTIAEAVGAGARTVALAPGSHVLGLGFTNVSVVGACPRTTSIRVEGFVRVDRALFRRVRITTAPDGWLIVLPAASLELEDVVFTDAARFVEVAGGSLRAHRVAFHGPNSDDGIVVFGGGSTELDHVSFHDVSGHSVTSAILREPPLSPASYTLRDVAVVGSEGISFGPSADVVLERVVIEGATTPVLVAAPSITVRDLVVRGASARQAVTLAEASTAVLERIRIEDVDVIGLGLTLTTATASDVVIRDAGSNGILVEDATLDLTRARIQRGVSAGIAVVGASGRLTAHDVDVSEIRAAPALVVGSGGGVFTGDGAVTTIERVRVRDVTSWGLVADLATLTASDVSVSDVHVAPGRRIAYGVGGNDSTLTLSRVHVHDVVESGLAVYDTVATVSDLSIADVTTELGEHGIGIIVFSDRAGGTMASLDAERVSVVRATQWGLIAVGPGTTADVSFLTVSDVARAPCGEGCPETEGGSAMVAYDRAVLTVHDFSTERAALSGATASLGVRVLLERGVIRGSSVGLIYDPMLPYNTGATPGVDLVDVELSSNDLPFQQTTVTIAPPVIDPVGAD